MRDAMADLDEISLMLGEIRSSVKHGAEQMVRAVEWMEKHEARDQERFEMLANKIASIPDHTPRIKDIELTLEPVVEHIEGQKIREYKLAGALVVIGGAVSLIGTVLFTLGGKVMDAFYG
jgi:rhamnose utilization protein RhaD (predicted bifunctional aldolase and dehydrogenase)